MITWFISFFIHSAVAEVPSCKTPDFESFKKARQNKELIIRNNPNPQNPDFSKKYKLLSIEYAMETAWYLLNCETGKFVPEVLYTDSKPSLAQHQIELDTLVFPKETHRFFEGKWQRTLAADPSATPTPAVAQLKANTVISNCKKIDFTSYDRARDQQKVLMESESNLTVPNFNGHYLLLRAESIFESYWLIADCHTGIFSKTVLPGDAQFKKDEKVVKIVNSGKFPKFYFWMEEDESWLEIRKPESDPETIKNTIFGKAAKRIFDSIPNPGKKSVVRFENLTWIEDFIIKTGKCMTGTGSLRCDIEF